MKRYSKKSPIFAVDECGDLNNLIIIHMNKKNYSIRTIVLALLGALSWFQADVVLAANPYLPLWEYIPDGEPYVFEDPDHPGKYRVYVYGSHDSMKTEYCGREQVVWATCSMLPTWWK